MSPRPKGYVALWPKLAAVAVVASMAVVACDDADSSPENEVSGGAGGVSGVEGGAGHDDGRAGEPPTAGGADGGGAPGAGGALTSAGAGGAPAGTAGEAGAAGSGAGGEDGVGEPVEGCDVNSTYGNLGDLEGGALVGSDGVYFKVPIQPGSPADQVGVLLFDGYGVFADGVTTGTFDLIGDELNYGTCGLCIILEEEVGASSYRGLYMATSGTVTLTSVEGNITGTLSNVTLEHVMLGEEAVSSPAPDGCTTSIKYLGFDGPIYLP